MSGDDLAFPFSESAEMQSVNPGLTKREWLAGMALQGIVASDSVTGSNQSKCWKESAQIAVGLADATIAALSRAARA